MNVKMMILTASAMFATSVAVAQEPPVDERLKAESNEREMKVERSDMSSNDRLFGTYRSLEKPSNESASKLTAGSEVYNEVTGQVAKISGNITVLADNEGLAAVAQQFGLAIVSEDSRTGLGLLKAPEGADLTALVEELRASDLVKAARIEVIEPRNQLHVIKR